MLIPRDVVAGIPMVAAPEETRYAIHGVKLDRTGEDTCKATATTGKALLVAEWKEGFMDSPGIEDREPGFSANLDAKELRKARTLGAKDTALLVKESNVNGTATVVGIKGRARTYATVEVPAITDGAFPNVEEIIPNDPKGIKIAVGARVLGDLLRACAETTGNPDVTVILSIPTEDGPEGTRYSGKAIRVDVRPDPTPANGLKVYGVFMPVWLGDI